MLVTACWSIDSTMHASEKNRDLLYMHVTFWEAVMPSIIWYKFWKLLCLCKVLYFLRQILKFMNWIRKKKLFLWFCCFCCILICFCYNLALCCLRQHYSKILVIITVRTLKLWTLDMFLCIFQWLWKEESFYNA